MNGLIKEKRRLRQRINIVLLCDTLGKGDRAVFPYLYTIITFRII
jgi:hypothetical protein